MHLFLTFHIEFTEKSHSFYLYNGPVLTNSGTVVQSNTPSQNSCNSLMTPQASTLASGGLQVYFKHISQKDYFKI